MADPIRSVGESPPGAAAAAVIRDWCEPSPIVPGSAPRVRWRSELRARVARTAWWVERRPLIARALAELDLATVARSVVRPRLAGFRSALRPDSVRELIGGGLGRGFDATRRRRRAITPAGFGPDADGSVLVVPDAAVPAPGTRRFRRLVQRAHQVGALEIDASTRPVDPGAILALARAGAPVVLVGDAPRPVDVPAPVWTTLRHPFDPLDPRSRELHSIRLRRAAWAPELGTPTVSVLLASRRPADLTAAVAMVAAQRGVEVQLCVGLHGPGWPADTERRLRAAGVDDLVVDRFADDVDLGQVLDALAGRADGRLVSKWDDDDVYGSEHLLDLAIAHHYCGAELVGKGAEFVYLEAIDTTIRRYVTGAERPSTTLAGGTLVLGREELAAMGGWPHAPRRVDGLLIDEVLRQGGSTYRTHGFQFVLRRRPPDSGGHTWSAPDDYFLVEAVEQRPSLALAFADIEPDIEPTDGMP